MNCLIKYVHETGISYRYLANKANIEETRIHYLKDNSKDNWELFSKLSLQEAKKLSFIPSIKKFIRQ